MVPMDNEALFYTIKYVMKSFESILCIFQALKGYFLNAKKAMAMNMAPTGPTS